MLMRKSIIFASAILVVTLASSAAIAEARLLDGTHTQGEIISACINNGGEYTDYPGGSFGCKTKKGEVFCTKTGTLNQGSVGKCSACNPACGQSAKKPGGKPSRRTVDSILTNAPAKKAQPLTSQKTTRPATTAPTRPLTSQKVTRSPITTPMLPLTQQSKTTGSAGVQPTQPRTASTSPRSRGR
jgi:hypothetical protein